MGKLFMVLIVTPITLAIVLPIAIILLGRWLYIEARDARRSSNS
jgi:hypothetical protein